MSGFRIHNMQHTNSKDYFVQKKDDIKVELKISCIQM